MPKRRCLTLLIALMAIFAVPHRGGERHCEDSCITSASAAATLPREPVDEVSQDLPEPIRAVLEKNNWQVVREAIHIRTTSDLASALAASILSSKVDTHLLQFALQHPPQSPHIDRNTFYTVKPPPAS